MQNVHNGEFVGLNSGFTYWYVLNKNRLDICGSLVSSKLVLSIFSFIFYDTHTNSNTRYLISVSVLTNPDTIFLTKVLVLTKTITIFQC